MPQVSILESGLVYRNPKPHLNPRQAYYPSVVQSSNGALLASFVIGSAMESTDCQVFLCRSTDQGSTWSSPQALRDKPDHCTENCRLTRLRDGQILLLMNETERTDPNVGAVNPVNLGHAPNEFHLWRSMDGGCSWQQPSTIDLSLPSPFYELCSPLVELQDGRLLLPTSTWRGWNGDEPTPMKAVVFVSEDDGKTWSRYADVMDRASEKIVFWEQKIVAINRNRLLSVAWVHDEANHQDLVNHYAIGDSHSLQFSSPEPTSLWGQTPELLHLGEGMVLCVYRRTDQPGLWACIADIDPNGNWREIHQQCLWQSAIKPVAHGGGMVEEFRGLKLGAPCLRQLDDQSIFLTFWCVEDCVVNIRWMRLQYR